MDIRRLFAACFIAVPLLTLAAPKTEIVVSSGHSGAITGLRFSKEGRFLVSSGQDGEIKLWDIASRRLVRTFREPDSQMWGVDISPDGRLVAGTTLWGVTCYEAATGRLVWKELLHRTTLSVRFSPDGQFLLATPSSDREGSEPNVTVWEASTGRAARSFEKGFRGFVTADFARGGSLLCVGGFRSPHESSNGIRLWDWREGKLLETVTDSLFGRFAVSGDGRYLAYQKRNRQTTLRDLSGGSERILPLEMDSPVALSQGGTLLVKLGEFATGESGLSHYCLDLVDCRTGRVIRQFHPQEGPKPSMGAFSPDGRMLAAGYDNASIRLFDVGTGSELAPLIVMPTADIWTSVQGIRAVDFSPDMSRMVAVTGGRSLAFVSFPDLQVQSVAVDSTIARGVRYAADGRLWVPLIDEGDRFPLESWNGLTRVPVGGASKESVVGYFPDGQRVIWRRQSHQTTEFIARRGAQDPPLWRFSSDRWLTACAFSPDGRSLVIASKEPEKLDSRSSLVSDLGSACEIYVLDAETGAVRDTIWGGSGGEVDSLVFSPDGKLLLAAGYRVHGWDRKVPDGPDHWGAWNWSGLLDVFEFKSGNIERYYSPVQGMFHPLGDVSFSPDGRWLAFADRETLRLRRWSSEQRDTAEEKLLEGHRGWINSLSFSPDSRFLLTGSRDGTFKLWNLATTEPVTFLVRGSEWLMYTEDGYFDGSLGGTDVVSAVQGLDVFGIDQFAVVKNRPDIVLRRLGLGSPEQIQNYFSQYLKRLAKMNFLPASIPVQAMRGRVLKTVQDEEQRKLLLAAYTERADGYKLKQAITLSEKMRLLRIPAFLAYIEESVLSGELHVPVSRILDIRKEGKWATLSLELFDDQFRLKSYSVFVNDVPLFGVYGKPIAGQRQKVAEQLELSRGTNKIEVSCLNEKGAESYRAVTQLDYSEPVRENLYFLGFGVSKYKDPQLNLSYADKDARDLAATFLRMQGGKFTEARVRTYINEDATSSAITQAKEFLKTAGVDDTLVLFISGHGVHGQDAAATYYYLTYETDLNALSATAADFDGVEELLQGIPPRRKLFLMDTCESGDLEESIAEVTAAKAGGRGLQARAIRQRVAPRSKGLSTATAMPPRTFLLDRNRFIYTDLVRRSGSIVFSSCRGGEFSYESDSIQNGYFTSEILRALRGHEDAAVTVDELRTAVSASVPRLTDDLQHPTVDRDNRTQKFEFPRLSDEKGGK